jgi:hypothetical protein
VGEATNLRDCFAHQAVVKYNHWANITIVLALSQRDPQQLYPPQKKRTTPGIATNDNYKLQFSVSHSLQTSSRRPFRFIPVG